MTDAERAARERVRLQAVAGFEGGEKNREIAAALRVSERSVERWRRHWRENGHAGVASKGSMAGMTCYKPGERSRPIYAIREYRGGKDEPKGFGRKDYRDLVIRARTQLGGPIVLVWDNLRMHLVAPLREFFEANAAWLTVFQLPTYAPDLNPQEGTWSLVKRDIGTLAAADLGQITRAVKRKLKMIQYRPHLIDGCLAGTGSTLD